MKIDTDNSFRKFTGIKLPKLALTEDGVFLVISLDTIKKCYSGVCLETYNEEKLRPGDIANLKFSSEIFEYAGTVILQNK